MKRPFSKGTTSEVKAIGIRDVLATWPHVVRALAMALAALALSWGVTTTGGLFAAMLGAAGGVVLGHRLAASRLKLSFIIGVNLAFVLVMALLLRGSVAWTIVPRILGPATTLTVVELLRFGVVGLAIATLLRSTAVRRPTFMGLELAFVAVAITGVFSSHREGSISRPLWLADWAFHHGIDPVKILLGVGFVAVAILATLLLVENKSGRAVSSLVILGLLAVVGLVCISAVGAPKPQPEGEAGFTDQQGETPPPPPPDEGGAPQNQDGQDGGGQDPNGGQDGGGGSSGKDASTTEGGAGQSQQDGGTGGEGQQDGGPPQPPPSVRLSQDPPNGSSNAPQPVAVVLFEDDYSPPSQAYYFRQEALSQWNGTRLVATGRSDADRDSASVFPTEPSKVPDPPLPEGRRIVRTTVALLLDHPNPFGLEAPLSFAPIPNPNPRFTRAYKVESLSQVIDYRKLLGRKAGNAKWSPDLRAYYTIGPSDPRYGKMAQTYVKDLPPQLKDDPFAKAIAVKQHLDKEFTYSTKVKYTSPKDPTADFLFGTKIGYCVHFAHAAVFLWRSLGLPARIGVGYHSEEDNRKGGSALLLKSGDAHAWPELYLAGVGWIILDIAAEKNTDPPGAAQDDDQQKLFGDLARKQSPNPEEPKAKTPRNYGRDIGYGALAIFLLAALVLYSTKVWRRIRWGFAGSTKLPRVAYRAALDILSDVGVAREYGETREDFAKRIKGLAPSFEEITLLHVAARLRDPQTPAAERKELVRESWRSPMAQLKKDLRSRTKLWRRFVGVLNPASFLASR